MNQNPRPGVRPIRGIRLGELKAMSDAQHPPQAPPAPVSPSSSRAPTIGAMSDIPFYREYLRDVVKPRVEHALRLIESNLSENVWRAVVATLAADQTDGVDPAALRALVQDQLGLKLEARLTAEFTNILPQPAAVPAAADGEAGQPADAPEVITAKRRAVTSNPLAQAVLDNRTRF